MIIGKTNYYFLHYYIAVTSREGNKGAVFMTDVDSDSEPLGHSTQAHKQDLAQPQESAGSTLLSRYQ